MADAKVVDLYAPAGIQLNYRAVTGYSHAVIMPHSLILKAIERGCVVRELKDDGSFIELTKDNYSSSNGGTEVPENATIPIDEEDIDLEAQKNKRNEYLEEVKKELNQDEDPQGPTKVDIGGEVTIDNPIESTSSSEINIESLSEPNDIKLNTDIEEQNSILKTNLSYTKTKSKYKK